MEPVKTNNYFYINSLGRKNGTSTNFTSNNNLFKDSNAYRVSKVIIPFTFYNVTSNYNVFSIISGVTTYNVTITPGQYTIAQFITALQTGLNALAVGVFTVTSDPISYKITITNATVPFTYLGRSSSYIVTGYGQSNIGPLLSITAPNIYNFSSTDYIDIKSVTLTKSDSKVIDNTFSNSTIVQRVPTNQYSFGQTILFMSRHPHIFTCKPDLSEDIDLILYDQWGFQLDLNGRDWNILFKYFTEKSNDPLSLTRVHNRNLIQL